MSSDIPLEQIAGARQRVQAHQEKINIDEAKTTSEMKDSQSSNINPEDGVKVADMMPEDAVASDQVSAQKPVASGENVDNSGFLAASPKEASSWTSIISPLLAPFSASARPADSPGAMSNDNKAGAEAQLIQDVQYKVGGMVNALLGSVRPNPHLTADEGPHDHMNPEYTPSQEELDREREKLLEENERAGINMAVPSPPETQSGGLFDMASKLVTDIAKKVAISTSHEETMAPSLSIDAPSEHANTSVLGDVRDKASEAAGSLKDSARDMMTSSDDPLRDNSRGEEAPAGVDDSMPPAVRNRQQKPPSRLTQIWEDLKHGGPKAGGAMTPDEGEGVKTFHNVERSHHLDDPKERKIYDGEVNKVKPGKYSQGDETSSAEQQREQQHGVVLGKDRTVTGAQPHGPPEGPTDPTWGGKDRMTAAGGMFQAQATGGAGREVKEVHTSIMKDQYEGGNISKKTDTYWDHEDIHRVKDKLAHAPEGTVEAIKKGSEMVAGAVEHVGDMTQHVYDKAKELRDNLAYKDLKSPQERLAQGQAQVDERAERYIEGRMGDDPQRITDMQLERDLMGDGAAFKRDTLMDKILYPLSKDAHDESSARELAQRYKDFKEKIAHSDEQSAGASSEEGSGIQQAGQEAADRTGLHPREMLQEARHGVERFVHNVESSVQHAIDSVRHGADRTADEAQGVWQGAQQSARETKDSAMEQGREMTDQVVDKTKATGEKLKETASDVSEGVSQKLEAGQHKVADTASATKDHIKQAGSEAQPSSQHSPGLLEALTQGMSKLLGKTEETVDVGVEKSTDAIRSAEETVYGPGAPKGGHPTIGEQAHQGYAKAKEAVEHTEDDVVSRTRAAVNSADVFALEGQQRAADLTESAQEQAQEVGQEVGHKVDSGMNRATEAAKDLYHRLVAPFTQGGGDEQRGALSPAGDDECTNAVKEKLNAGAEDTAGAIGIMAGHAQNTLDIVKEQLAIPPADIPEVPYTNTEDLLRARQQQQQSS